MILFLVDMSSSSPQEYPILTNETTSNENNSNNIGLPNNEEPSTSSTDSQFRSTQYSFTPSPENSKTSTKPDLKDDTDDDKRDDSMYVCNICLDIAKESVITMVGLYANGHKCVEIHKNLSQIFPRLVKPLFFHKFKFWKPFQCGHLYCWPCLHCWLETSHRQLCPVCKAAISKDKVVPLYGRNSERQQDPRSKNYSPRPSAQRTEPDNSQNYQGFQTFGDGGFHLSFGIGAFPFGFFASSFNFNDLRGRQMPGQPGTAQFEEDQFLSKVFLWVAIIFFCWLILA